MVSFVNSFRFDQLYHASKILLALHEPWVSSRTQSSDPFFVRRELGQSRENIFMIANSMIDEAWV